ncbi:MAG: phosphoribosyltransferase [Sulfolobales archaeon]
MPRPRLRIRLISWEEIVSWVFKLADLIRSSGWTPTTIVAIARGGYVPARLLCDFLGVGELLSIQVVHWIEADRRDNARIRFRHSILDDMGGRRVLLVDDIVDTGLSMILAREYVEREWKPREIKTAAITIVTSMARIKPDYYVEELKEREWDWYIYPWKRVEDLTSLIMRMLREKPDLSGRIVSFNDLNDLFMEWYGLHPSSLGIYWSEALRRLEASGVLRLSDNRGVEIRRTSAEISPLIRS